MPEPTPTAPQGPKPATSPDPAETKASQGSQERSVGELVFDVSERTSSLIREEIELAKAEVSEKVGKILRGSVVGIAAGTFAFLALILFMEGFAWLLNEELFDGKSWPGFFLEAALFLLVAAGAGFFAYRSVQAGAPPMPEQAIQEAKLTKAIFEGEESKPASSVGSGSVPKAGGGK